MCIFCKIVTGDIICYKLYEDDIAIAILDISQASKGHTLVIPKQHYDNILSIDEKTYQHLSKVVLKICKSYQSVFNTDNFNIINNCGPIAGQSVNHFHIHIIPRYKDDNILFYFPQNNPNNETLEKILSSINIDQ